MTIHITKTIMILVSRVKIKCVIIIIIIQYSFSLFNNYHYSNYTYYQIVAAIERKGRCDTVQGVWNGLEKERDK